MIRPAMQEWHTITTKLIQLTGNTVDEQRDNIISAIESQLDARDQLLPHIHSPFTVEEQQLGKELIILESSMKKSLETFTKQIRNDITDAQLKKDNMKSYVNPYSDIARDGAYYDTKQ